jgi:hypothetical protein
MKVTAIASYQLVMYKAEAAKAEHIKITVGLAIKDALDALEGGISDETTASYRQYPAVFAWNLHMQEDEGSQKELFIKEYEALCRKHNMFICENDFLGQGVLEAEKKEDIDSHIQFLFATFKA